MAEQDFNTVSTFLAIMELETNICPELGEPDCSGLDCLGGGVTRGETIFGQP